MRRGSRSHTEWQHQPLQWKTCSCALDQTKSIIFPREERTASAHPPAMTHQPPGSSISPWCGQTATEKGPENTPSTLSLLPASCVQLERYDAFCPSVCSPSLLVVFSFSFSLHSGFWGQLVLLLLKVLLYWSSRQWTMTEVSGV